MTRIADETIPLTDRPVNRPVLLTDYGADDVLEVTQLDLDTLGLGYSTLDGEFFPLTDHEFQIVGGERGEQEFKRKDGAFVLIKPTALYLGNKWVAPELVIDFGAGHSVWTRAEAVAIRDTVKARLIEKLADHQDAFVQIDIDDDDAQGMIFITAYIKYKTLIEDARVETNGDYIAWLKSIFGE